MRTPEEQLSEWWMSANSYCTEVQGEILSKAQIIDDHWWHKELRLCLWQDGDATWDEFANKLLVYYQKPLSLSRNEY